MIAQRPAAVVCDMDGLLVDSERLERRVWQAAAGDLGVEMSDERFASVVGHPAGGFDRRLGHYNCEAGGVCGFRAACHRRMSAIVEREGVALRPGALEWIEFVRDLGIPLGLATSSAPSLVGEGRGDRPSAVAAGGPPPGGARGEAHPDLYLEAAARLGVAPEVSVALEDSPTGAQAALAAGMPVVLVPDLVPVPPNVSALAVGVFDSLHTVREAFTSSWVA